MTAACLDEAGGTVSLVLPTFTPQSFASLPEAFCAALKGISTLIRALETLYGICQDAQQKLEDKVSTGAPGSSAGHAQYREKKTEEQQQGVLKESHAVFPVGSSHHSSSHREEYRDILCQVESVLQHARLFNCNAEQYNHLLAAGQPVTESVHSSSNAAHFRNAEDVSHTDDKQQLSTGSRRRQMPCDSKCPAFGQSLREGHTFNNGKGARRNATRDEEDKSQDSRREPVGEVADKTLKPRSSWRKGDSTRSSAYELSVCRALLMLQHLDLSEGNRCCEDDMFFSLEHQIQQRQQALYDTQNDTALQRETFYSLLQREVLKCESPTWFRHEQETLWRDSAGGTTPWHQQLQRRRFSPSLQSVLSGGPFIKLEKAVVLEILLRIKMLQEAQRVLRADIIMMRHQHYKDGQILRRTLQETAVAYGEGRAPSLDHSHVTMQLRPSYERLLVIWLCFLHVIHVLPAGVEKKALLSRLQKLAELLQSKW